MYGDPEPGSKPNMATGSQPRLLGIFVLARGLPPPLQAMLLFHQLFQLFFQSYQFHLDQTRVSAPADLSEDEAQPVARDPFLSTFMEHCKSFVCDEYLTSYDIYPRIIV